jgi:Ni/Co efflux regulator RcnB
MLSPAGWRWDVKRLTSILIAGAVVSVFFSASAEAAGKGSKHRRVEARQEVRRDHRQDARRDAYFRDHDLVVIRDYYRPYYRPLPPGLQKRYARTGSLPPGWAKRMRPLPVYVERDMARVPRGYHRGVIDGRAVVYNDRGFILDVAVIF